MKKVLSFLFLFALSFLLVGCDKSYNETYDMNKEVDYKEELTGEELTAKITEIAENQTEVNSINIELKITGTTEIPNEDFTSTTKEKFNFNFSVKLNNEGDEPQVDVSLNGKVGGDEMNAHAWYKERDFFLSLDIPGETEEESINQKIWMHLSDEDLATLEGILGSLTNPQTPGLPTTPGTPELPSEEELQEMISQLFASIQKAGTDSKGNLVFEFDTSQNTSLMNAQIKGRVVFSDNKLVYCIFEAGDTTISVEVNYDSVNVKLPNKDKYEEKSVTELLASLGGFMPQ